MNDNPHWLDQQYNPFLSIGGVSALFSDWGMRSGQARAAHDCFVDLPYGPTRRQTLDLFPARGEGAPVLVFIHGGYWRGSDKAAHGFLAPSFVAMGAVVVLLNYDLCPTVPIGTICEQVAAALAWIHRHIASYGGDPRRIVLAGHSAGAHLAAMALLRGGSGGAGDGSAPPAKRALCISGLFDLAPLREAPFIRGDLALDPGAAHALSPVHFPAPPGGRVVAAVGALESEAFQQQTDRLQASWGRETVPVVDRIANRNHFDILNDLAEAGTLLHTRASALLLDRSASAPRFPSHTAT